MTLRRKILLTFIGIIIFFSVSVTYWSIQEGRNVYAFAIEEVLVDVSRLFSEQIKNEIELKKSDFNQIDWSKSFDNFKKSSFYVEILKLKKTNSAIDVYVTNAKGIIVYSSRDISEVGQDYSSWRDVKLTLEGKYGTRATRTNKDDKGTSTYYVAAPIKVNDEIVGVVSIIKPRASVTAILDQYMYKIVFGVVFGIFLTIIFGLLLFVWLTKPIEQLNEYAVSVSEGRRGKLPSIPHADINRLAESFENMRLTLEGQKTIEKFIQTLIHELKSPLSAIRGSSELLLESMSDEQRNKFINNIITEGNRSEIILDKILKVAELESQKYSAMKENFNLIEIIGQVKEALSPHFLKQNITLKVIYEISEIKYFGDAFLIRQALRNLIENALDFSKANSEILILVNQKSEVIEIIVEDFGTGIPEYAEKRIFEKFYSLERPNTGKKGTGLGLNFVYEVISLHSGTLSISNKKLGPGVIAKICLPLV